uniref:Uncharacterized protein n=1 Tax=Arundo donax TaxID=35708 RepID=A0A0A9H722_ARUDO
MEILPRKEKGMEKGKEQTCKSTPTRQFKESPGTQETDLNC